MPSTRRLEVEKLAEAKEDDHIFHLGLHVYM